MPAEILPRQIRSILADIAISRSAASAPPFQSGDDGDVLRGVVEAAVLDREVRVALAAACSELRIDLDGSSCVEGTLASAATGSLAVLNDREVAHLAICPWAIERLAEMVGRELPAVWFNAMRRVGDAQAASGGR